MPELMVMDSASIFKAQLTQEVGALMGIRMHNFPAYSQYRNGKVERVHRYLGHRLKIWRRDRVRNWHKLIPFIEMSHHFTVMPQYNMSPHEILFGFGARLPFMQSGWESVGNASTAYRYVREVHIRLMRVRQEFERIELELVMKRIRKARKNQVESSLLKGDKALVYTKGTKDKLTCIWSDVVEIRSKSGGDTYVVRYPNGETARVPSTRLRKYLPSGYDAEDAIGPFVNNYPSLTEEGDSKGKPSGASLLPRIKLHAPPVERKSYRYVGAEGEQQAPEPSELEITYGDYVAHLNQTGGWSVSQYLGSEMDDGDTIQLRKLGTFHENTKTKTPREYVWRYHWLAKRGKHVLAPVGKES